MDGLHKYTVSARTEMQVFILCFFFFFFHEVLYINVNPESSASAKESSALTGSAEDVPAQRVGVVVAAAAAQVHVVGGVGARHVGRAAHKRLHEAGLAR